MNYFTVNPLYLCISIFLSSIGCLTSQNKAHNCGTTFSHEQVEHFNSIKADLAPIEQKFLYNKQPHKKGIPTEIHNYIPVKIHLIRYSDQTCNIGSYEINNAIDNLNETFAGADIEFFVCGDINYINDDKYTSIKKGEETTILETNNISGLINIYLTPILKNESNDDICGFSNNSRDKDFIFIKNSCVNNASSLSHEMGHFFSLIHTHGIDNNTLTTELVDGSNCDTDGDGICDTPADPMLSNENVNNFCEYIGSETDANGQTFNPDTGNMMSYSKKACRTHFSEQQLARMYAFYITQKHYLACPDFNADFTANLTQTCEESLTVNFNSHCSGITKWEWDIDSDGTIDYTDQNPTHTFDSGIYDVTLTVHKNSKKIRKSYPNFIKVGVQSDPLFDENFNSFNIAGDNGWTSNDVNNSGYTWLITHGNTSSESTGPVNKSYNNDGKLNKYIYTEASGANEGDIAEFISPCIDIIHENSEIQFSYHMFGDNIGELHVDIKTSNGYINDVIKPIIGSQQANQSDDFLTESIDLSSYAGETINIRFRAIRGNGWKGDIAIDDVFLKTISVPISDDSVRLYPNPVSNNLLYIKTENREDNEVFRYEISNLVGQKFSSGIVTNQPINTSNLSSGSYLLTLVSKNYKVVKRFIK